MSVAEIIAYEEKTAKLAEQIQIEKDLLKKDQQLDPYLEKLMELKLQQSKNFKFLGKLVDNRGWSQDITANKLCKIKIRAVGLDFEIVKWIERNLRGLRDCFELSQQQSIEKFHKMKLASAKRFVKTFF